VSNLVTDRTSRIVYTLNRETSCIRAPVVALASYIEELAAAQSDTQYTQLKSVTPFKAEPEQQADYPAACVFPDGDAEHEEETLGMYNDENMIVGDTALILTGEISQMLTIHLWANEEAQRDMFLLMLEDGLFPVEWMPGFSLDMPHYYGSRAVYLPRQVTVEDSDQDNIRRYRKLIWRVQVRSPRLREFKIPRIRPVPVVEVR